jgi:hypothetical protein
MESYSLKTFTITIMMTNHPTSNNDKLLAKNLESFLCVFMEQFFLVFSMKRYVRTVTCLP